MNELKPMYGAAGTLAAPLRRREGIMYVDPMLYSILVAGLEWKDWTYLLLDNQYGILELVKVVSVLGDNAVGIFRGQDYTCPRDFTSATIKYVETTESLLNKVAPVSFTISTFGGIGLEEGSLVYPQLNVTNLGSTEVVGQLKAAIGTVSEARCCNRKGTPDIPDSLLPYREVDNGELRHTDEEEIRSISG